MHEKSLNALDKTEQPQKHVYRASAEDLRYEELQEEYEYQQDEEAIQELFRTTEFENLVLPSLSVLKILHECKTVENSTHPEEIKAYYREHATSVGTNLLLLSLELTKYDLGEKESLARYMTDTERLTTRRALKLLLERVLAVSKGYAGADLSNALGLGGLKGCHKNKPVSDIERDAVIRDVLSEGKFKGDAFCNEVRARLAKSKTSNDEEYFRTFKKFEVAPSLSDDALKKHRAKLNKQNGAHNLST